MDRSPAAVAPPPSSAQTAPSPLVERLRAIAGGGTAPEDMLDPALAAILEGTGAAAGAICLYDQRNDLLRLAAESGLSDEGCRRLRSVRRGDVMGWDMPLHSLLNRRVYLIESASRNRYVPPLVEAGASVRAIACLPVLAGTTALGSVVLVIRAPRVFSEQQIRGLEQPLREVARMIEAAKRRGSQAAQSAPKPALAPVTRLAPPRPVPSPAPIAPTEAAADEGRVQALVASLAAAEREQARLAAALETAAAERAEQARREAALEAARTAEVGRLVARLADVEAAAARERELVADCEREQARVRSELAAAVAREEQVRGDLEVALARSTADREQELRDTLARARAAETTSATANAEAEAARTELERVRATIGALEEEKARASAEVERLQGNTRATLIDREELERMLAAARTREEQARSQIGDLERRIEALRAEHEADSAALTARLESATAASGAELETLVKRLADAEGTAARERERVAEWERVHARLAEELRETSAREQRAQEEIRAATEQVAVTVREDLQQALVAARTAEAARAAADADAQTAHAALAAAEAACRALEAERAEAQTELARLRASADGFLAERERLEGTVAEMSGREEGARARLAELESSVDALRAERDTEVAALTARLEVVGAERDQLRALLAAIERERNYFTVDEAAADAAHARLEEALVREVAAQGPATEEVGAAVETPALEIEKPTEEVVAAAVEPPAAAPAAPPASPAPAAPPKKVSSPPPPIVVDAAAEAEANRRMVVLDADLAWQAAQVEGYEVVVLSPREAPERIIELAPSRLAVNLAAPGALDALVAVRAAGSATRLWACIANPQADRALPLGMVEVATRPLDPDAVLALLRSHAAQVTGRGCRVLTAGADADACISLRQALARQGMSVSMAWDGKQAAELLTMTRPDVVVVELGLPPRAGYGIVAQLAGSDPIPVAVLIPADDDPAPGFTAALANPMHAARVVPLARLLARVLGRTPPRRP